MFPEGAQDYWNFIWGLPFCCGANTLDEKTLYKMTGGSWKGLDT